MANDKIMVTVTVPEGLRAVVEMIDVRAGTLQAQEAIVTGGTSQDFFVDTIRGLRIKEGFPHCMANALDRKPDSE